MKNLLCLFPLLSVLCFLPSCSSWREFLSGAVECAGEPIAQVTGQVVSDVEKAVSGGVAFDSAQWKATAQGLATQYGSCLFKRAVAFVLDKLTHKPDAGSSVGGEGTGNDAGRALRTKYLEAAFKAVR